MAIIGADPHHLREAARTWLAQADELDSWLSHLHSTVEGMYPGNEGDYMYAFERDWNAFLQDCDTAAAECRNMEARLNSVADLFEGVDGDCTNYFNDEAGTGLNPDPVLQTAAFLPQYRNHMVQYVQTPIQSPPFQPGGSVWTDLPGTNVRSSPSLDGGTVPGGNRYSGRVNVIGRYVSDDGDVWYRVVMYPGGQNSPPGEAGWVHGSMLDLEDADLPAMNADGEFTDVQPTPISPTATPVPAVSTFDPSTVVIPEAREPRTLTEDDTAFVATVAQGEWQQEYVDNAISHLSDSEYETFLAVREQLSAGEMTYEQLDAWWMSTYGRGLMDVPPEYWSTCADGDTFCANLTAAAVDLYNHRQVIGVEYEASGLAQDTPPEEWLIPGFQSDNCQGPVQSCWVCQDISTKLLFQASGFNLGEQIDPTNAYASRFAPTVAIYYHERGLLFAGDTALVPSLVEQEFSADYTFQQGDTVFLTSPNDGYYHSGMIVSGGVSLADVTAGTASLDDIYVAQLSYSSPSYSGNYYVGAEVSYDGRFEVIPLSVYAARNAAYNGVDPTRLTDAQLLQYISIGARPPETIVVPPAEGE